MIIKKLCFTIVTMFIMISTTCFAQITTQDLNIGGIYIGQSMNEILEKHGDSIRMVSIPPVGKAFVFMVNGSEIVITPKDSVVIGISIDGNSKLVTSKGVGLHASLDKIIDAYGMPDVNNIIAKTNTGDIRRLEYYTESFVFKNDNDDSVSVTGVLSFGVNEKGDVDRIIINEAYEFLNNIFP